MNPERLITSANWVRNELLVRLAHRIRDFQQLPFIVGTNPHIEYVYRLYWGAFETMRQFPPIQTESDNDAFCDLLRGLLEDGLLVLPKLARGLSESVAYYPPDQNDLDLFLNRMLRSRISRRVLAEQHLALTEACEHQWDSTLGYGDGYVGIIFVHCSAQEIVKRAKLLVYQHIQKYHYQQQNQPLHAPNIEVSIHPNSRDSENEILFAYIPEQLEHILYELLDNAVRFTMKRYPNANYPPIKVTVSANDSDVYFRISDQGGGMTKDRYERLWSYQARARTGDFDEIKEVEKLPTTVDGRANQVLQMGHRHLGIGLTMSRIYAEYWGGELQIITMDGYGTDVYVRIPRLGTSIENLGIDYQTHPVFQDDQHQKLLLKKKDSKHAVKGSHKKQGIRLQSKPDENLAATKQKELLDTSLTSKSFSGSSWSESHMIRS
ncbi:hypothetical protein CU097_007034 [Rhizopus azygosporus]|uniref:Protein-serine/threonine kinase n=1 Tax=Rhizopus azygosporus TaxID=86630 RepID=A0A367JCH0_RHIAZ|nr:hypothetical protein CU097_007034 [Rhizopus azygosporus]